MRRMAGCIAIFLLVASTGYGQITIQGADGSDGALNCETLGLTDCETNCTSGSPCAVEIDLSLAADAPWTSPSPVAGRGIYDADQWAVIFKYTSVDIPAHVTVTFKNHPSRAPVMWLVSGDANIAGTINLNGAAGHSDSAPATYSEPGPGGFRGGRGQRDTLSISGGFGPGGGSTSRAAGGYGTAGVGGKIYGNPGVFPLIGGSGSSGYSMGGGAAGGGAILIACPSAITLSGSIRAQGGQGGYAGYWSSRSQYAGGGSGGGIRLIADSINCGPCQGQNGLLRAEGGWGGTSSSELYGGTGRIRVEANTNGLLDPGSPPYTEGLPGTNPRIFKDSTTPTVAAVALGTQLVPADPRSRLDVGEEDVLLSTSGLVTLEITVRNVPINDPVDAVVEVRVVSAIGTVRPTNATYSSGDLAESTWLAEVDLPDRFSAINVRVILPTAP